MKRKILLFSLVFLLVLFVSVNGVSAACVNLSNFGGGNEYIANSSITICRDTYYMNDSEDDGAIIVNADNIEIDLNGSQIIGNLSNGALGFNITEKSNVTIRNGILKKYGYGVYANNLNHSNIFNMSLDNYGFTETNYGLYISDSNNITLENSTLSNASYGIYFTNSQNVTIFNVTSKHNGDGLYLKNSNNFSVLNTSVNSNGFNGIYLHTTSNSTISHNIANNNGYGGISLYGPSINCTISNNYGELNEYGFGVAKSNGSLIHNNTFVKNIKGIDISAWSAEETNNNYTFNKLQYNLNSSTYDLETSTREVSMGTRIDFNISMRATNGSNCSSCAPTLILYPHESDFSYTQTGHILSGNFTPTKIGVYSLKLNTTDTNNNFNSVKYLYFVNLTDEIDTISYYFRNVTPTHGQPGYPNLDYEDTGSLLLDPPTTLENRTCGVWVQFSPNELPTYLFGKYIHINYSINYSTNPSSDNYTGVERSVLYDSSADRVAENIISYNETSGFKSFSFSVNWTPISYYREWYFSAIEFRGSNPVIYSSPANPSYVNISYSYPTTPAIKGISGDDVQILSAVMDPSKSYEANVSLYGTGTETIELKMPENASYIVYFDGTYCNDANCNYTQNDQYINVTANFGPEHNITITNSSISSPNITLMRAGNLSENYRNGTLQIEDWIYIEVNVSDTNAFLDTVLLEWKNQTEWTNHTMTDNGNGNYSINISNQPEYSDYTFNVLANNTAGSSTKYTWIFEEYESSWGTKKYYRKYVGLNQAGSDNMTYKQFYMHDFIYNSSQEASNVLPMEQSTGASIYDTGIGLFAKPTDVNLRTCSVYTGFFPSERLDVGPNKKLTDIYIHVWWYSKYDSVDLAWNIGGGASPENNKIDATDTTAVANSSLVGPSTTYPIHLEARIVDITNTTFSDNDIYDFFFFAEASGGNPIIYSSQNEATFIIFNLPNNTTLNNSDTDSDGLNDYEELFTYYTDPNDTDTDGGGESDYSEIKAGRNPLLPSDDIAPSPAGGAAPPKPTGNYILTVNPPEDGEPAEEPDEIPESEEVEKEKVTEEPEEKPKKEEPNYLPAILILIVSIVVISGLYYYQKKVKGK